MVSMSSWTLVCGFVSYGSAIRTESVVPKKPSGPEFTTVEAVKYFQLASKENDIDAQTVACKGLIRVGSNRDFEEYSTPGGPLRLPTWYLEEGYADIAAQALLRILASEGNREDDVFNAAKTCVDVLADMNIQDDNFKCDAMRRNSPHLWDALVGYFRRFGMKDQSYSLFSVYGKCEGLDEVTEDLDRAGGFDLLLGLLDGQGSRLNSDKTDPAVLISASTALSDLSHSSTYAAKLILKHDGPKILVDTLRKAHASELNKKGKGASPRMLALENVKMMLGNDKDKKIAKAFLKAGLIEDGLAIMADDPKDFELQQSACETFISFATGSTPIKKRLEESPAWDNVVLAHETCGAGHCHGKVNSKTGEFDCRDCDRCTALVRL